MLATDINLRQMASCRQQQTYVDTEKGLANFLKMPCFGPSYLKLCLPLPKGIAVVSSRKSIHLDGSVYDRKI